jgi:diadenosine tetraphosphate (Ap4A) HIT family hydrolase
MKVDQSCYSCATTDDPERILPPRERIADRQGWRVAHAIDCALPGWLVLVAKRHVTRYADLTAAEATELGLLSWQVSRALTAVTGCQKTYVAMFSEATRFEHLHVHLVPRAADLPADERGPAVFTYLHRPADETMTPAAMDAVAVEVTTMLGQLAGKDNHRTDRNHDE